MFRSPHGPSTPERKRLYPAAHSLNTSPAVISSDRAQLLPAPLIDTSRGWISSTVNAINPGDFKSPSSMPHFSRRRSYPYNSGASQPDMERFVDTRRSSLPGPQSMYSPPRFVGSQTPSPHPSPASSMLDTPDNAYPLGVTSPRALPSWRDGYLPDALPPIHRPDIYENSSLRDDLPHLLLSPGSKHASTGSKSSPHFLDVSSPSPSSPVSERSSSYWNSVGSVSVPQVRNEYRYEDDGSISRDQRHTPENHFFSSDTFVEGDSRRSSYSDPFDFNIDPEGYNDQATPKLSHAQDLTHSPGFSLGRSPLSVQEPSRAMTPPIVGQSHKFLNNDAQSQGRRRDWKYKSTRTKGKLFTCTYKFPKTGKTCDIWSNGWTAEAALLRHAETEHAEEEINMIERGELTYDKAQVVRSREKHLRLKDDIANTRRCPDCGTGFSSKRKDSVRRHQQTDACAKARKRGKPTQFPKKPKGSSSSHF